MNSSSKKKDHSKTNSKAALMPLSVRFTQKERKTLEREAGKLSLSAYIRRELLGDAVSERKPHYLPKRRKPQIDHKLLAQLLGTFGASELGRSMIAISLAAQSGALSVDDELTAKLEQTCNDISEMRSSLIIALGIKPQGNGQA